MSAREIPSPSANCSPDGAKKRRQDSFSHPSPVSPRLIQNFIHTYLCTNDISISCSANSVPFANDICYTNRTAVEKTAQDTHPEPFPLFQVHQFPLSTSPMEPSQAIGTSIPKGSCSTSDSPCFHFSPR